MHEYGREFGRGKDVGGDKVRTVRESSFIWGGQAGYTRNGKTNRKREFTGPRFTTSIMLKTVLLRRGPDGLSWKRAAQTAMGMSMVSMVVMELAENAVDSHLTGGVVALCSLPI